MVGGKINGNNKNGLFSTHRVQLDLRFRREFRIPNGGRQQATVDFYNVLNDGLVLSSNPLYGDRWRVPESGSTTVSGSGASRRPTGSVRWTAEILTVVALRRRCKM
jgi:hypothetical protein